MNELSSVQKWMELSYEWQFGDSVNGTGKYIFRRKFGLTEFKAKFIDFF